MEGAALEGGGGGKLPFSWPQWWDLIFSTVDFTTKPRLKDTHNVVQKEKYCSSRLGGETFCFHDNNIERETKLKDKQTWLEKVGSRVWPTQ